MSVRLFVLGILDDRDAHGYELRDIAQTWNLSHWADVGYGSIYHALGKLTAEGMIREERVEQHGGRPARTVYAITEAGRAEFVRLLREAAISVTPEKRPVDLALAFICRLPSSERVELLNARSRKLESVLEILRRKLTELRGLERKAPWALEPLKFDIARHELELRWNRELLTRIADWEIPAETENAPSPAIPPAAETP